jgi:RND superfamily putative drug exporter
MGEAAREGVLLTGGMITGAGLIMVTVFIVLLTSPLEVLQTLGIGMSAAILLDTWIVRTFLVPGITTLLGQGAFWPWRGPGRAKGHAAQGA